MITDDSENAAMADSYVYFSFPDAEVDVKAYELHNNVKYFVQRQDKNFGVTVRPCQMSYQIIDIGLDLSSMRPRGVGLANLVVCHHCDHE